MKNSILIFLLMSLMLIAIPNSVLSQTKYDNESEIKKRLKLYHEVMGTDEGWTLAKERKGIKVYHRKVDITPIKVFKGVAELESDLTSILSFLMDVHKFPSWIMMTDSAMLLKPVDEDRELEQVVYYLYTVNRPPWPIRPRDNVVYAICAQDPETMTVRVKALALPEYIPHKKGFVRCPILMMEWKFKPLNNGNTEFTFETLVDVGGFIPDWVINCYSVAIPYMTIQNIRKLMPFEDKYRRKTIKELKLPPSHVQAECISMEKLE